MIVTILILQLYIRGDRPPLFASNHVHFTVLLLHLTHIVRLLGSLTAPPPLSPRHFVLLLDYSWTHESEYFFYWLSPAPVASHPAISGPVFSSRESEVLCSVCAGTSSGKLPAEFLTCHSNLPAMILLRFRFVLICVWFVSIASVPCHTVRTAHLVLFQSYLCIQMCTPSFRSLARRRTFFPGFSHMDSWFSLHMSWPIAPSTVAPGILLYLRIAITHNYSDFFNPN